MFTNVYEIFVASFNDSNGDHYGDLKGIIERLDYIKYLGNDAIWLMPINPSDTYHKYNIDDYYDIDSLYGTLDDFKLLIKEAHKRNISIIIDLVINHTSNTHMWFKECFKAHKTNDYNNKYYDYYNFGSEKLDGYVNVDGLYYEARFGERMPDLNLDNINVRNEISNIINFYNNIGVDGYRLDAVTSYYTNDYQKNSEFLNFLRSVAKDKYIVGEAWTHFNELKHYYNGYGSLFSFYLSDALILSIRTEDVTYVKAYLDKLTSISKEIPLANFISNHDTNRAASLIEAKFPKRVKLLYGICGMIPGILYSYYGDEIAMIGEGNDPNRRIPILWGEKDDLNAPDHTTDIKYVYPSVKEQVNNSESILHYYRNINHFRINNKHIFNSNFKVYGICDNKVMVIDYMNSYKAYINLSEFKNELDILNEILIEEITVDNKSTLTNNKLIINGYSIVIMKIRGELNG